VKSVCAGTCKLPVAEFRFNRVEAPEAIVLAGHLTAAWTELGRVFSSEGEASTVVRT
jgi:hypothetical protein